MPRDSMNTFRDYVAGIAVHADALALTSRTFLKVNRVRHGELRLAANRTANFLASLGVKPGDRVMVVSTNAPEWIELLLGALLVGAVVVPVDAASSEERVLRFAKETSPTLLFSGRNIELSSGSFRSFFLDELDELTCAAPDTEPRVELDRDAPAVIVFTSGTTADPKGVVLTQGNILANVEGILRRIDVREDWRFLSVLPLSHMYEMSASLAILSRGASIFYVPRVTPRAIVEALNDYQINSILSIPQLLSIMLERIEQAVQEQGKTKLFDVINKIGERLPFGLRRYLFYSVHKELGGKLRLVVTGGAPIPVDVGRAWERMGVRLVQGYGLTETSPILTCNGLDDRRLDSAGRALDNVALRIASDGEIQAKGPSVFKEYLGNEVATNAAFSEDGWVRTGDVGSLDDGWLHIQGRLKFVIVRSSGLKVFPEDVELAASDETDLTGFCVVGAKDDKSETVVGVVRSDAADDAVAAAIARVNAKLESFQHIDSWRRWPGEDFPRTRLLKIDRRQVQDWVNQVPSDVDVSPVTASGDDQIMHVIRLSLDNPMAVVRDSDRLDDLGLDSLRRLMVVSLLEEQLGIAISDEAVTPETTVAQLRALVAEGSPDEDAAHRPRWPYWRPVRMIGDALRDELITRVLRRWVTLRVEGTDNLANISGPAIFIFNHSDDFDGPVVYQALPRKLRSRLAVAAGDDVLRDHRGLAFIIRLCFAGFSFARSEPFLPSLEYVGSMLDRGWNVLIAPEGHIDNSGTLQPFKSGIGLLAVNLGVPIVPVKTIGLTGTVPLHAKWPKKRSQVTVRIGKPQVFARHDNYEEVTDVLYRVIEEL